MPRKFSSSLILFSLVYLSLNCSVVGERTAKLINATTSQLTYFPCMVQIITTNQKHVCGGCILDDENVITSARCVKKFEQKNNATDLIVRGGDVEVSNSKLPTFQSRDVVKFIVHPQYNEANLENDVAILKINDPFMPSVFLHDVLIGQAQPKGRCLLPGWTDYYGNTTQLHYMTVYVTNDAKCSKKVPNTICVESKTQEGACAADYGGPLVCDGKVYGVFVGPEDACQGKPALFTDLSRFSDWLEATIHQDQDRFFHPSSRRRSSAKRMFLSIPLFILIGQYLV